MITFNGYIDRLIIRELFVNKLIQFDGNIIIKFRIYPCARLGYFQILFFFIHIKFCQNLKLQL